jgi:MFS family permease
MAGGMFGSVLGMAAGGMLAQHFGWRWSFAGMAFFGLALAAIYPLIVREARLSKPTARTQAKLSLGSLFATRSVICAYVGSGLQLFIGGALIAWMPSFLNRYYDMSIDRAGVAAAVFVLAGGAGMIVCGMLSDKVGRGSPQRKLSLAVGYCLLSVALLTVGFSLPPGSLQLTLIGLGMFVAAGTAGPAGAMVANLTNPAIHGTAFATLTLANNLLGLAPGPFATGVLADHVGLQSALQIMPAIGIAAAAAFVVAKRSYLHDLDRIQQSGVVSSTQS